MTFSKIVILSSIIGLIAIVGDYVEDSLSVPLQRAIIDNVTHSIIAVITWIWIGVASNYACFNMGFFVQTAICGLLASILDLDHFVAAFSVRLSVS